MVPWVGFPWKQKGCEVIPGMVYRSWGSEGRGSVRGGEVLGRERLQVWVVGSVPQGLLKRNVA